MAKFSQKDIFFKDDDMAVFGTGQDSKLFWDGTLNDLCLTTTISGVDPIQDYHLTTKYYVDQNRVDNFLGLTDTPSTYSGSNGYYLRVTESGTLGIEFSNDVNKYVSGAVLYPNAQASDVGGYNEISIYPASGVEQHPTVNTSTSAVIEEFITNALDYDIFIPAGKWIFNIYADTSSANQHNAVGVEVYERTPGGSETLIFDDEIDLVSTSPTLYNLAAVVDGATLESGNRLVFKFLGINYQGGSKTIGIYYQGTTRYTNIDTPISVAFSTDHSKLNNLDSDDHLQYVPTSASRGFTNTVSGVDPTQDYHLTTKYYVDTVSGALGADLNTHVSDTNNPHTVTLEQARTAGNIMTGGIVFNPTSSMTVIDVSGSNLDLVWMLGHSTDGYGYYWKYEGTGTADANYLYLYSENGAGADYWFYRCHQTTQVMDINVRLNVQSDYAVQFRDSDIYINSTDDGYLDLYADTDIRLHTTASGVDPTQDYHLTTKYYVDQQLSTSSGIDLVQFSTGMLQLDSANAPAYTNIGPVGALLFDPTTDEAVYGSFKIPTLYKSNTNISVEIQYMNATLQAGTNSCVWALDYHSYVDGETYGSKTTTTINVTDALPNGASAGTFQETSMTMAYNNANNPLVAGDTITFRFYRDANNGSDTMTGDAGFLVLVFKINVEVAS